MIAKTNRAHEVLTEDFKAHTVSRKYMAVVHNAFNHGSAIIDAPIGRDPKNRQKMAVTHTNSKEAKTKVYLEEALGDFSRLRCELETGRTHQIRVHLEYIKHPIVGDKTYSIKTPWIRKVKCCMRTNCRLCILLRKKPCLLKQHPHKSLRTCWIP